jgi:hypothetical protein
MDLPSVSTISVEFQFFMLRIFPGHANHPIGVMDSCRANREIGVPRREGCFGHLWWRDRKKAAGDFGWAAGDGRGTGCWLGG